MGQQNSPSYQIVSGNNQFLATKRSPRVSFIVGLRFSQGKEHCRLQICFPPRDSNILSSIFKPRGQFRESEWCCAKPRKTTCKEGGKYKSPNHVVSFVAFSPSNTWKGLRLCGVLYSFVYYGWTTLGWPRYASIQLAESSGLPGRRPRPGPGPARPLSIARYR